MSEDGHTEAVDGDESELEDEESHRTQFERVLTWALALALVVSLAGVVYIAMTPAQTADPFTEFYILGPDGNASGYPTNMTPGGQGDVVVGISNHEHESMTYRVEITWNGSRTQQRELSVPNEQTREFRATLTAPREQGRYRVRFLLYKNGGSEPDHSLRLWVTVRS